MHAVRGEGGGALLGDGQVAGARRDDHHPFGAHVGAGPPHDEAAVATTAGVGGEHRSGLLVGGAGEEHRPRPGPEQLADDGDGLLDGLPGTEHGLGPVLAQRPVVVDAGEPEVGEGEPPQLLDGVVGSDRSGAHALDQGAELGVVHVSTSR